MPSPIDSVPVRRMVAARRKAQRETLGLTTVELAARIKVSHDTLEDWESAAYWPLPEVSARWRGALRCQSMAVRHSSGVR
jgi:ribosome-binding protein aMBF1 (putative translation factor)